MKRTLLILTVVACTLAMAAPIAQSCSNPPPPAPPDIWVRVINNGLICIEFHNYATTFASASGTFCACAFKNFPNTTVVSVEADPPELGNFVLNATTGADAGPPLGGPATGFQSSVDPGGVPGNQQVRLRIYLQVNPAVGRQAVLNQIAAAGPVVLTDEAGPAGNLLGTHQGVASAAAMMAVPTLNQWGLIAVVLVLLTAGTFYIVRRQRAYNA